MGEGKVYFPLLPPGCPASPLKPEVQGLLCPRKPTSSQRLPVSLRSWHWHQLGAVGMEGECPASSFPTPGHSCLPFPTPSREDPGAGLFLPCRHFLGELKNFYSGKHLSKTLTSKDAPKSPGAAGFRHWWTLHAGG